MPDPLLEFVNRAGCQVVACAQTGLHPPDLYVKARDGSKRKLIRRGPLADYLREKFSFEVIDSETPSFSSDRSASVAAGGGAHVLGSWLQVFGITSPKVDLGFADQAEVTFALGRVNSERVEPSQIDRVLDKLALDAIAQETLAMGFVHIAYEYLYTTSLTMRRKDGRQFGATAEASISDLAGASTHGKFATENHTALTFTAKNDAPLAFAYRAGRLTPGEHNSWYFEPVIRLRRPASVGDTPQPSDDQPYIPFAGDIIEVD
jgi:hypothetical protein